MRQIVLLSDYGNDSIYIGLVKGMINKITKKKNYIDLFHDVDKQSIINAAFLLSKSYQSFAEDSIFCCLVDPEINSDRKVIIAKNSNQYFVAPDNGLLTSINCENTEIYEVNTGTVELPSLYSKNLITYTASELSKENFSVIGKKIEKDYFNRLNIGTHEESNKVHGIIAHIDNFGNIITNIENTHFKTLSKLEFYEYTVTQKTNSYSEADDNTVFAYPGSFDTIEVGIKNSNANNNLNLNIGDKVTLKKGILK